MRPVRRVPPREPADRFLAAYDMSPTLGWGTYPERGYRNGNLLVWEEGYGRFTDNHHPMASRLSTDSLQNLVTAGRTLGMLDS